MPTDAPNKIAILAFVSNNDSNYCALSCTVTGGYTVDWGDGSAPVNVASGIAAEHKYAWADLASSPLTINGFRQAMIVITPTVGGNAFTAVDLGKKHSRATLNAYAQPWADLQLNAPSCTSFVTYSGVASSNLERANITAIGGVTSATSMFQSCYSLSSVSFPSGSLAALTNATNMFQSCSSLVSVSFPSSGPNGSLTTTTTMFSTTPSLARIINCSIAVTFSIASAKLARTELVEIFNSLPTVVGQTITITGNHGVVDLTAPDLAIATGKGWTVVT